MIKVKSFLLLNLILTISVCLSNLQSQNSSDVYTLLQIKNLHKIDEGVYRSSQPNNVEFEKLEKSGLKNVLNLRRWNSDNDEAKNTTLNLFHVKIRAEAIKEDDLLKALLIIKNREGDILIHCHHGSDRTGAVAAMYRIVFQNWSKEQAIEELKNGGYGFHNIYTNIPRLINNIDIESFKKKLFMD